MLMERSYSLWMIVCAGWRTQPGADRGKWGGGGVKKSVTKKEDYGDN